MAESVYYVLKRNDDAGSRLTNDIYGKPTLLWQHHVLATLARILKQRNTGRNIYELKVGNMKPISLILIGFTTCSFQLRSESFGCSLTRKATADKPGPHELIDVDVLLRGGLPQRHRA